MLLHSTTCTADKEGVRRQISLASGDVWSFSTGLLRCREGDYGSTERGDHTEPCSVPCVAHSGGFPNHKTKCEDHVMLNSGSVTRSLSGGVIYNRVRAKGVQVTEIWI